MKIKYAPSDFKPITKRMISIAYMYVFGEKIKGTNIIIDNEQDLDIVLAHYKFLQKYKLV